MNEKDCWLENMLDGFFAQERKKERDNFWNNREPKQRISKQERDTINVFSNFITNVNSAPSKKSNSTKTKSRSRLESGGITARV